MKRISDQIDELTKLPRAELVRLWIKAHRAPPPKGIGRRLLELSAAYIIQAKMFGDLDRSTKRALTAALSQSGADAEPLDNEHRSAKNLNPGSRLVRVWNGKTHQIEVLEKGFRWNDRSYRSLSAIAREITGARWSGPKFFGI